VNSATTVDATSKETLWKELLAELASSGQQHLFHKAEQLAQLSQPGIQIAANALFVISKDSERLKEQLRNPDVNLIASEVKDILAEWNQHIEDTETKHAIEDAVVLVELLGNTIGLNDSVSRDSLLEKCSAIEQLMIASQKDGVKTAQIATTSAAQDPAHKTSEKTMRIAEAKIDIFLAHVGELLTIGEMYNHLHSNISRTNANREFSVELRRVNEAFGELSRSLQSSIMTIRKIPLQPILLKLPRIIRDIASTRSKQIETIVVGGEISIDKSIADLIEAPLVHLARNAADHGIEAPQVRNQEGKPQQGHVEISAAETAEHILLEIKDDGQGLDLERLTQKAISMGLIEPNARLSEQDTINLLFQSGVSTANEISEISGRGVGMDVVKRAIEGMGGSINVSSIRGKGSIFSMKIPKTVSTQIFSGFIVILHRNRYVFPLDRIIRSFQASKTPVFSIVGQGLCVKDGEYCLPIVPLTELFGVANNSALTSQFEKGMFVVLKGKTHDFAVHVDVIEGIQQVVLKNIEGLTSSGSIFLGGAIMGDSNVAMVVDFDRVVDVQDISPVLTH